MELPSSNINALFEEALRYDHQGDTYNAVKLYKKLTKLAPQWSPPYQRLAAIYKNRREWKPALHYIKRSLAINPTDKPGWWDLGIAATALRKWRIARNVWGKFGKTPQAGWAPGPVSIRCSYNDRYEIMWTNALDPARAAIQNIPHPDSERRFRDVILYDRVVNGYQVIRNRRFPVYDELGLYKRSPYHTYSCRLETSNNDDVELLGRLCQDADLGFEIWSNAVRQYSAGGKQRVPEYYGPDPSWEVPEAGVIIAIAARREKHVLQVLRSWKLISLSSFSNLESYG